MNVKKFWVEYFKDLLIKTVHTKEIERDITEIGNVPKDDATIGVEEVMEFTN